MNLTTLANVQAFALSNVPKATQSAADDPLLNLLIRQASNAILNYLGRPNLARASYTDRFNGNGGDFLMLPNWPVIEINSVLINQMQVTAQAAAGQTGYVLESFNGMIAGKPQGLYLMNLCYERGTQNVTVGYQAGYAIVNEAATVSAANNLMAKQPYGTWCQDDGVTYANGTPLTPVTSNPSVGQYSVAAGAYTFNAADDNAAVLISYSFIPSDVEQACIETVSERYKYKSRIGTKTQSMQQMNTTYDNAGINEYSKMLLNPYRKSFVI